MSPTTLSSTPGGLYGLNGGQVGLLAPECFFSSRGYPWGRVCGRTVSTVESQNRLFVVFRFFYLSLVLLTIVGTEVVNSDDRLEFVQC